MLHTRFSAALLASILVVGCSTGSSFDALSGIKPSRETTSSIARPLVPAAAVPTAEVGYPVVSNASPEAAVTSLAEPDRIDSPALQQVAMVVPSRPAAPRDTVHRQRFRDAKPVSFGRVTPQHHAVHGVDVSRWQGKIDWSTLRSQGANFAFIKATDGGDHLDPTFHRNWKDAADAGVRRGAYHFFYWCRTGAEQAEWFIRNVPKTPGALPPVIDVEYNHQSRCKTRHSPKVVREKMQAFMDRVERHYGQRPIIYTAPDFYADNLRGHFKDYPFWLRSVAAHPSVRYPNRTDWMFWQYSGTGLSKGVTGHIDLNVFRGSEADWNKWLARAAR